MQDAVHHLVKNPAHALRLFLRQGARPETAKGPAGLLPPHLASFRTAGALPGDFPACVVDGEEALAVIPVRELVEEAVDRLALEGEEAARCMKVVQQLGREMAGMARQDAEEALSGLWGAAATSMIANPDLPEQARENIRRDLSRLRKHIQVDGPVLAFHPNTPLRLLRRAAARHHREQARRLQGEVEALRGRLSTLLDAEADRLPETRRERLAATLEALQAPKPGAPEDLVAQVASGTAALDRVQAEVHKRLALFRALYTARLEVEAAYDEDEHDAFFAAFGPADLDEAERALFPPIGLHLDTQQLDAADVDLALSLLEMPLPVKLLVTVDALYDGGAAVPVRASGWRAQLAERALTLGRAFVLQATAAQARLLGESFANGLRHDGPALFCVYTGTGADTPHLPPYLAAAAALPSRVFPAFVYDPSKGDDWAARFRLAENPQPERPWPRMNAPAAEGAEEEPHPFTAVDLLACDAGFDGHFMVVPPAAKPEALVPLEDYLAAAREARREQIPYVLLVDERGKAHQVACTRSVARAAETVAAQWRCLQEWGGINNSHAARAAAAEKERLTRSFDEEKQALVQRHQEEIEEVKASLAPQIVSNIAAGLLELTEPGTDLPMPPPEAAVPKATPAEAPAAAAAPEPAPAEAEEEPLSFDEPYIETPECTSCDECLNINDRLFAYDEEDKAYIKDPRAGSYEDLVTAAENCPAKIIHPGKPLNPDEPGLEALMKRAEPYL